MQKRIVALVLALLMLLPGLVLGEESGVIVLPQGQWMLTEDGGWLFVVESDTPLAAFQVAAARSAGITVIEDMLPSTLTLSYDQLLLLYPGMEDYFQPKLTAQVLYQPELEMFSLTGEWYYGDDGNLYYNHGKGYAVMTVDQVFAALQGESAADDATKIVYLTIDDGPSQYTMELLSVLDALDVKATFFVVGAYVKQRPVFLLAIYEQGHAIANHSYTHDADTLNSSFQSCLNDFLRCERAVADALGFDLEMPILRIPYGAATIPVSYRTQLQQNGYLWIDWNALNGDTEDAITSDEAALERAISTAKRYDGDIVLLVHDGKKRTIRTLPQLVEYFRGQGYEFRVLDTNIGTIPGVRMGLPKDK